MSREYIALGPPPRRDRICHSPVASPGTASRFLLKAFVQQADHILHQCRYKLPPCPYDGSKSTTLTCLDRVIFISTLGLAVIADGRSPRPAILPGQQTTLLQLHGYFDRFPRPLDTGSVWNASRSQSDKTDGVLHLLRETLQG
jgi:hypothetical protein